MPGIQWPHINPIIIEASKNAALYSAAGFGLYSLFDAISPLVQVSAYVSVGVSAGMGVVLGVASLYKTIQDEKTMQRRLAKKDADHAEKLRLAQAAHASHTQALQEQHAERMRLKELEITGLKLDVAELNPSSDEQLDSSDKIREPAELNDTQFRQVLLHKLTKIEALMPDLHHQRSRSSSTGKVLNFLGGTSAATIAGAQPETTPAVATTSSSLDHHSETASIDMQNLTNTGASIATMRRV